MKTKQCMLTSLIIRNFIIQISAQFVAKPKAMEMDGYAYH